ncbi:hypothetical protein B0H34DRAFT_543251 [Crassisporium funariophilum]|nr:hypothetical protein B0H34DRAFT_543251 [Crassisporium funariophilum]
MTARWEGAEEALKLSLSHYSCLDADQFLGKLEKWEEFWVGVYPFLLSKGYRLRPRYDPEWLPSWSHKVGPIKSLTKYEDALMPLIYNFYSSS